ncbi:hypothetical protein GF367_02535 [Candidatus Woesearchaeota archaeon]|nr:hypothetical protein [Candidatus Woesearchaeota archaeon]
MRAVIGGVVVLMLVLAGCDDTQRTSAPRADEHGCLASQGFAWCESKERCVNTWEEYCPLEGESDRLMTVDECNSKGGVSIDYGGGKRCDEDQKVIGEVAGLLSLHVCCYPRPEGWQGY